MLTTRCAKEQHETDPAKQLYCRSWHHICDIVVFVTTLTCDSLYKSRLNNEIRAELSVQKKKLKLKSNHDFNIKNQVDCDILACKFFYFFYFLNYTEWRQLPTWCSVRDSKPNVSPECLAFSRFLTKSNESTKCSMQLHLNQRFLRELALVSVQTVEDENSCWHKSTQHIGPKRFKNFKLSFCMDVMWISVCKECAR